jgi:hypothetical protein
MHARAHDVDDDAVDERAGERVSEGDKEEKSLPIAFSRLSKKRNGNVLKLKESFGVLAVVNARFQFKVFFCTLYEIDFIILQ